MEDDTEVTQSQKARQTNNGVWVCFGGRAMGVKEGMGPGIPNISQ